MHPTLIRALRGALLGVILVGPAYAQAPDWTQRPALGPPPRLALPPLQRFTLSNGLEVVLMERRGVPLVQVNLLVRAGSVDDPAGREGLAAFTADMLDEGAGGRSALELADALDHLGVQLGTGADHHHSLVALHTPSARLDSALALMATVALRPDFPPHEIDRLRDRLLVAFQQRRDQPRALASLLFGRVLYGEAHPYGRPVGGEPTGIRALTRDDLVGFHRSRFQPGAAALIVVGDVSAAAVRPRLEALFGATSWPAGAGAPPVRVEQAPQVTTRTVYLVDRPDAQQTVVMIGRIGAARSAEEFFALQVLNTVLGGSFTSRLNQNLRETHGYTYGAGSSFAFRPVPGPFLATADVQTDATGPALAEFFNELRGIGQRVPDDELGRARSYAALSFPEAFETVRGAASMLGELWLHGLADDYYGAFTDRLLAVTPADVQAAAERYIDAERVAVVIVGDRSRIEEAVRTLDLGEVRILTIDDVSPAAR